MYARVARLAFHRAATYRIATLGGAVANTLVAFLLASVLLLVVSERGDLRGLDAAAAVTYTFVVFGLDEPVGIYQTLELTRRIRSGDVSVDLYRPFDVQLYWLANEAGRSLYALATRLAPPMLFASFFFDLRLPTQADVWFAFACSVVAAMLVSFTFRFVVSLSAFWMLDGRGVQSITGFLVAALGGTAYPLQLYPGWVGDIARALPFATVAQFPAEVFLGMHRGAAAVELIGRQLMWAVVFALMGRALLGSATRRLVVQGG